MNLYMGNLLYINTYLWIIFHFRHKNLEENKKRYGWESECEEEKLRCTGQWKTLRTYERDGWLAGEINHIKYAQKKLSNKKQNMQTQYPI